MKKNLKKLFPFLLVPALALGFQACEEDEDDVPQVLVVREYLPIIKHPVQINFKNLVNGDSLRLNTADKPYQNNLGQAFNITRLRYMLSDFSFHFPDGTCYTIDEYHLVDASDPNTLTFSPESRVPEGNYTGISFKFGFDREDNKGNYPPLNDEIWQWSPPLGGGYHFMQMDGKFDTSGVEGGFNTHMGTARNLTPTDTSFEDNHFSLHFDNISFSVPAKSSFEVVMEVDEWYKAPYNWDFKVYNSPVMPNYGAQRKLNLNGPSVFTINL